MLDRILYFLFRRKTGLIIIAAATILCAVSFSGCFTLSMCACGLETCAECMNCEDEDSLLGCAAGCFDGLDKGCSCDTGCNLLDCLFGYGCEEDYKNGTVYCGGLNKTCFTKCENDCSGSTCNGCETCYFAISNCKYEGDKVKERTYSVTIRIDIKDASNNTLKQFDIEKSLKANDLTLQDNLTQSVDLSEIRKELDTIRFFDKFESMLELSSGSGSELSFNEGSYEFNQTIDVTIAPSAWDTRYNSTVTIIAKAREKVEGESIRVIVDYSSADYPDDQFTVRVGQIPQYNVKEFNGYIFEGLYTKDINDNEIPFDTDSPFRSYQYKVENFELTIYAKYSKKTIPLNIVKSVIGFKTEAPQVFEVEYGKKLSEIIKDLKQKGLFGVDTDSERFVCWTFDKEGYNPIDIDEDETNIRNERTVYCIYEKTQKLTIIDGAGYQKGETTVTLVYDERIKEYLPTPTEYNDYLFDGWYLDSNFTQPFTYDNGTSLTEDLTIYAKWVKNTTSTIVYYSDLGAYSNGTPIKNTTFDSTVGTELLAWEDVKDNITLPDGYTFVGWRTISSNKELSDRIYSKFTGSSLTFEYSVIAEFERDVTLYVQKKEGKFADGSLSKTQKITYYKAELPIPESVREDYYFKGWSTTREEPYNIIKCEGLQVLEHITSGGLYAVFDKKPILLVFNNGDGTNQSIDVKYGENVKVEDLTIPTKKGHEFIGWYDKNDNKFDENAPVTTANDYTAKFEPKEYTITLKVNGEIYKTVKIKYGEKRNLDVPTGYYFNCWRAEDKNAWTNSAGEMTKTYDIDGDLTLIADLL